MMDNNKEIIANLIERINNKKNVKNNIINKFFLDKNNIKAEDIYPTINYRYENNIDEINIPITNLREVLSNKEELDTNIGDKEILFKQLNNNYYLSEQDVINKNIIKNIDIANSNNKKDIKEFQLLVKDIISDAKDYKKTLNKVTGGDFEYLISLISQGKNIDNVLNMEYIPYDKIKNNINKELEDKDLQLFLKNKKINKNNYNIFKNYYSTKSNNKLFDIFKLNENNTLYFEKISVMNLKMKLKDGRLVSPKTDIKITFFTLDNTKSLKEAYENRIIYFDDTLNISLKQDSFGAYQTIKVNNDGTSMYKNMEYKISDMTSDMNLAKTITNDCFKYFNRKYEDNINSIEISITPNNSLKGNRNFNKDFKSSFKLKDIDKSDNFKSSMKFLYGNFKNSIGNANALLHVKNKSSLGNINSLLKLIEPISNYNTELIERVKELNIIYSFSLRKIRLFNFEKVKNHYTYQELNDKYIIYDSNKPINENFNFNDYLFKDIKDLFIFSKNIITKLRKKYKIDINTDKPYESICYILNNRFDTKIKNIYNYKKPRYEVKITKK